MIEVLLENKNVREKANIKSREIAKLNFSGDWTDLDSGISIEIKNGKVIQIDEGIGFYARAFKNGKPIGFGSRGRTEWERFRMFNPPILTNDPNGTIIREHNDVIT